MKTLSVATEARECFVDITREVARAVENSGVRDGLCTVFVPHTTAAVTINENADPDVCHDILQFLAGAIPQSDRFRHTEGNSDAHIKATLVGSSVQIPIDGGELVLGTWQGIFFAEFDGPRTRKCVVMVQGTDR